MPNAYYVGYVTLTIPGLIVGVDTVGEEDILDGPPVIRISHGPGPVASAALRSMTHHPPKGVLGI